MIFPTPLFFHFLSQSHAEFAIFRRFQPTGRAVNEKLCFLFVDHSFHSRDFTSRRRRGHSLLSNARLEKANVRESVGRRRCADFLRLEPCLGWFDNAQLLQQIQQQLLQGLVDRRRQQYRHVLLRWFCHFFCDRILGSRA